MQDFTFQQSAGLSAGLLPSWLIPAALAVVLAVLAIWLLKIYLDKKRQEQVFLQNRSVPRIIQQLRGEEFEIWVKQLLLSIGAKAEVVGGQGDHGLDVLAEYQNKKIGIQCKKYWGEKLVGEPMVRDLYGVKWHENLDKVVLMTTGNFSRQALTWAQGKRDLSLVNAKLLERIILDRNILKKVLQY